MSPRSHRPLRVLTLVAVLAACLALPAFAGAAAKYSVKWSKSAPLTNAVAGTSLTSVACTPTDTSTAATNATPATTTTTSTTSTTSTTARAPRVGTTTTSTTSTTATNTTSSATTTTTPAASSSGQRIVNATNVCLAGDSKGGIWASVHPGKGKVSWHRERVDTKGGGVSITAISCPALNLCVALDAHGQVMHSTEPTIAAKDWTHATRIDSATQPGGSYAGFSAISCPSTKLCVAVDNNINGQVAFTTDPAGAATDWKVVTVGTGVVFDAVSCPTTNLCVLGGSARYYSVDPTGAATAWTQIGSLDGVSSMIASFDCNTIKLCVSVGYGNAATGLAASTGSLATSGGTWTGSYIGNDPPSPKTGLVDSVACPTRNFCIAVDGASDAYITTTPVRGRWAGPRQLKKGSTATYSALSCNETVCVEVDNRGTATYGGVKVASATTKSTTATKTT